MAAFPSPPPIVHTKTGPVAADVYREASASYARTNGAVAQVQPNRKARRRRQAIARMK